jgi:hypothetical protein
MASSFVMTIIFLPDRQCSACCAFANDFTVIADYYIEPGRINGTAIRVALIRDTTAGFQEFLASSCTADATSKKQRRRRR